MSNCGESRASLALAGSPWTEQGTFLASQRLRRPKSVNNAGFSELKPGVSALLLGGDSGPRVLVGMCSDWCPQPGFASPGSYLE